MKPHEAEQLAEKIVQTWPRIAGAVHIWTEDLMDLDAGAANTTYVRLRREADRAPSIADFRRAVQSMHMVDASNADKCGSCGDSGWVHGGYYEFKGQGYTAAQPCGYCRHGEKVEASQSWRSAPTRNWITEAQYEAMKPKRTKENAA